MKRPGSEKDGVDGPLFHIDDELFLERDSGAPEVRGAAPASPSWPAQDGLWPDVDADLPGPDFAFPDEEHPVSTGGEPIIDRDDEVPDRYWAPEVAGLGRRALALLVDQSLLMAVLGIFFVGAFLALRINGFDTRLFLAGAGLQASALPFALLAAVLSFAYCSYFHASTGRTPGKALVGIEVRAGNGGALTWDRAIVRWFGAALGLTCAGVGLLWAIFDPRHRGWADLVSGTVVARLRREAAGDGSPR
jgi:uncharacterized RDD family membrane protein YckC